MYSPHASRLPPFRKLDARLDAVLGATWVRQIESPSLSCGDPHTSATRGMLNDDDD